MVEEGGSTEEDKYSVYLDKHYINDLGLMLLEIP